MKYAWADVAVADAVVATLESNGVKCWIAPRDVKAEALYAEAIVRRPSSPEGAPMSHKHEQLVRAIFREPASGNIHWRDIESLLHHLGATVEPVSGARVRVRLNGVEGILHRPHHSNVLDRQGIRYVREYLAHARVTPSQYEAGAQRGTPR